MDDSCRFQKYNDQRQVAKCSGFLVGKNLLVTAAHCIRTRLSLFNEPMGFGHDLSEKDKNYTKIKRKDVYRCVEVIESSLKKEIFIR